jgi:hypothetical protein
MMSRLHPGVINYLSKHFILMVIYKHLSMSEFYTLMLLTQYGSTLLEEKCKYLITTWVGSPAHHVEGIISKEIPSLQWKGQPVAFNPLLRGSLSCETALGPGHRTTELGL